MDSLPPLLRPIVVPLVAGLVCWILGRRGPWTSRILAFVAAALTFGLCARIWSMGGDQWSPLEPWMRLGVVDLQIALKSTPFTGFLALAASVFTLLIVLFSFGYGGCISSDGKYYAYVLWTMGAAIAAFFANDLIFLLMCWEILSLLLYLLINLGREDKAPAGAAKTFALVGFSDCALLLGIVLVLATQGTVRMDALRIETGSGIASGIYLLFLCAALAKAGAIPLHSWIPSASEGAPISVMAFLPASLDKLLGIYLLARISFNLFVLDFRLQALLMIIGAITILAAVFMAMIQHDLRRLLSFHAVSQVGYMVLGLGTGTIIGIVGGLFHMLNHAIYKSCLFLCAGKIEERTGEYELDRLGGLARHLPVAFVGCSIAALAISGVPPLNGFVSKWLVYQGVLAQKTVLAPFVLVAAVFGSALTLASFVKVVHSCFWGAMPEGLQLRPARRGWATAIPILVLALLCVGLGLWAQYPVGFLAMVEETELGQAGAMDTVGPSLEYVSGLWTPGTATLLILAGMVLGLVIYWIGKGLKVRTVRNFVAGEILPESTVRFSGTSFYETIRDLPGFNTLFKDGESGAYDVYRLGGRYGHTLVEALRRMHTGVLLVYVSWCVIGLILILGYLLRA